MRETVRCWSSCSLSALKTTYWSCSNMLGEKSGKWRRWRPRFRCYSIFWRNGLVQKKPGPKMSITALYDMEGIRCVYETRIRRHHLRRNTSNLESRHAAVWLIELLVDKMCINSWNLMVTKIPKCGSSVSSGARLTKSSIPAVITKNKSNLVWCSIVMNLGWACLSIIDPLRQTTRILALHTSSLEQAFSAPIHIWQAKNRRGTLLHIAISVVDSCTQLSCYTRSFDVAMLGWSTLLKWIQPRENVSILPTYLESRT